MNIIIIDIIEKTENYVNDTIMYIIMQSLSCLIN